MMTREQVARRIDAIVERLSALRAEAARGQAPQVTDSHYDALSAAVDGEGREAVEALMAAVETERDDQWEEKVVAVLGLVRTIRPGRECGRCVRDEVKLLEQAMEGLAIVASDSIPTCGWKRELRPTLRLAMAIQRRLRPVTEHEAWLRRQLEGLR
jgi:hypothetical protein